MSLALALNNALSGLRLNQKSIAVLSNNIANVNTVGYSRQFINQSAVVVEGVGSGVRIDEITRKIDKYLQRATQTQGSANMTNQTISDYYERIQAVLGQPGRGNSIDSFMTGFFNSIQALAETPEITSLKSNAIGSASALAKQISDLAANIFDLRFQADKEIADSVVEVNGLLDRLYSLNGAINQAKSLGQTTAGLLDERDKALGSLSEYMNISVTYTNSGAVSVVGGDGLVLLEEGVRHQLRYNKAQAADVFVKDSSLNPLEVITLNDSGQQIGHPLILLSGGKSSEVVSKVSGGSLAGLQQMRDVKFPAILEQLDQMASRLRDGVNKLHNTGSGHPPATVLTGDRMVHAGEQYSWTGSVRIAVLQSNGMPVKSSYADEAYTGLRPLTLDLGRLNSGQGDGKPTLQTIVDEINNHFNAPGNKAQLGNVNNIQLASDVVLLPNGSPSLFNFDLDIDNISDAAASMYVNGITVLDDTGTNITNVTQGPPTLTIQSTNSYTTTLGSADVTISLATPPSVSVGDKIYLNSPSAAVNGISQADLTGYFTVTAVSGNSVTFTAAAAATSSGSVSDAGNIQMMPPYGKVAEGQKLRMDDQMQVNLSGNLGSKYYDITVNMSVVGEDGVVHTAPVTYRVQNNEQNIMNRRYSATAVGGAGTMVLPTTSQESLRAILVDADGKELPRVNGKYVDSEAYLKIVGGSGAETYSVAIDDLDSQQLGRPDESPSEEGTYRGFSHYFGLNNFFASNNPVATGDEVRNSALNLKVQDRLVVNADLLSTGKLVLQSKSAATDNKEIYTYARFSGDNSIAQAIGKFNTQVIAFDEAGGLPQTQISLQSYTGEILGYVTQRSAEATANAENSKVLYEGFKSKSSAISGVNLDEELANTITFQNAYSATARVVTIVNKMYEDLLQST